MWIGKRKSQRGTVKRDSKSGKRNLAITPRLERIYELGKELSWSDKFIFVKEREYVTDEDIANDNVCVTDDAVRRALKTMCKKIFHHINSDSMVQWKWSMNVMIFMQYHIILDIQI